MSRIINLSVRNYTESEISQLDKDDREFPHIVLTLNDEQGNEIGCTYMYPLRGYFFQIGGLGAKGAILQGHRFFKGAKCMIQIYRSLGMDDGSIKDIFNSEASYCILDFIKRFAGNHNTSYQGKGFISNYGECDFRVDPKIGSMTIYYRDSVWTKFIDHTFEYFDNQPEMKEHDPIGNLFDRMMEGK